MKSTPIPLKSQKPQITTLKLQKIQEPSKTTKIVIEDYDETNATNTSYSPPLYDSSTSNSCSPSADSSEASTSYSDEKENNFCKNCFQKEENVNNNNDLETTTEWSIRPDAKWKVRSIGLLAAILPESLASDTVRGYGGGNWGGYGGGHGGGYGKRYGGEGEFDIYFHNFK
uniref:Uncharacterized protein n=1 Tax=Meloidogyne hapla TaxID=6305 RepID=A0A1I8BPU2_MELHA